MRELTLSNGSGVPIRSSLLNQFMSISPKKIGVAISRRCRRLESEQKSKPSCGWWNKMPSLQKTTCLKGIGMGTPIATSIIHLRVQSTYFSNVP
jgi:hypothetical protein